MPEQITILPDNTDQHSRYATTLLEEETDEEPRLVRTPATQEAKLTAQKQPPCFHSSSIQPVFKPWSSLHHPSSPCSHLHHRPHLFLRRTASDAAIKLKSCPQSSSNTIDDVLILAHCHRRYHFCQSLLAISLCSASSQFDRRRRHTRFCPHRDKPRSILVSDSAPLHPYSTKSDPLSAAKLLLPLTALHAAANPFHAQLDKSPSSSSPLKTNSAIMDLFSSSTNLTQPRRRHHHRFSLNPTPGFLQANAAAAASSPPSIPSDSICRHQAQHGLV
ncbi:hypothetical protein M0R45_026366 [Rubus argutus]|uniref:Uncharacterized protein n=1 Tax=Rubus argutus TaxID=59490 RepID=A0AAW1WXY4_RUBAR